MCCNNKVSFGFKDIATDNITHIDGVSIGTPATPQAYIASLPLSELGTWWIERDRFGTPVLCTNVDMYANKVLTCTDGTPYTSFPCEFVGPHPKDSHGHIV